MKRLRTLGLAALIGLAGCDSNYSGSGYELRDEGTVETVTEDINHEHVSFQLSSGNCYTLYLESDARIMSATTRLKNSRDNYEIITIAARESSQKDDNCTRLRALKINPEN